MSGTLAEMDHMLAESFFDETNSHKGRERLCVAGYIFLKEAADQQAIRWAGLLEKWGLPYFHMVDCAHSAGAFSRLSKADCDLAARDALTIIKQTASTGVCVTVLEADYIELVPQIKFFGSAYDSCARDVITGVAAWIGRENFSGEMHYFFEEGANTSSHASWSIAQMMKDRELRAEACYAGHTFIPKIRSPGLQAADILAWHAGQDCKRALAGKRMRKDFESLTEIPHSVVHLNRSMLKDMAALITEGLAQADMTEDMADKIYSAARSRGIR
jgi:hypothetical protein